MFDSALLFVHLITASIWIGGYFAVIVVTRITRRSLPRADQIVFFRHLGQIWGGIASIALGLAIITGVTMLIRAGWPTGSTLAVVVAGAIVLATAVGVRQARMLGRQRRESLADPSDEKLSSGVRTGAKRAIVLRGLIGVLTLLLVGVGSAIVS